MNSLVRFIAGGRPVGSVSNAVGRPKAFEQEGMHAANKVNGPRLAHAILTAEELLALLPY